MKITAIIILFAPCAATPALTLASSSAGGPIVAAIAGATGWYLVLRPADSKFGGLQGLTRIVRAIVLGVAVALACTVVTIAVFFSIG